MGLSKLLQKKPLTDAEREHKAKVKAAYDKAFQEAEITAATERGKLEGSKATAKKGGLINTIGRAAEGALYGINKGAKAFNDSMGSNDFVVPKQEEILGAPKGSNDIFYGTTQRKSRKKHNELEDPYW